MLFNFVFTTADANNIPSCTALHNFNGKRCRVKLLGIISRSDGANAAFVQQVARLDFTQGLYTKHATITTGGSNQAGSIAGIPFVPTPFNNFTGGPLEFEAELWGEQLTLTISRAVDPPYTASASLAIGPTTPLLYLIAHFDIELLE